MKPDIGVGSWGEDFPNVFKAALRAAARTTSPADPRLAASLPARAGSDHRETGGHAEAPAVVDDSDRGDTARCGYGRADDARSRPAVLEHMRRSSRADPRNREPDRR